MKNTEEQIVKRIYELISDLPMQWEEVVFYAEYGAASFMMEFYLKTQDGYVKCFDVPGLSEEALDMLFWNVNKTVKPLRMELEQPWTSCTVRLHRDGRFKVDYDYTDLTDCAYEYHQAWKKKFLV